MSDFQTELTGRHFTTLDPTRVNIADGKVASIEPSANSDNGIADLPYLAPAFLDLQVNGYGGREFSSPDLTVEHVAAITREQYRFGVTKYLPTVTTASFETIVHAMRTIVAACGQRPDVARAVVGVHLEGPYISRVDGPRGAHPLEHCRPPDFDEFLRFQEAAQGMIRLVTLSAEYDESPAFIRRAVASGVTVAIGHMNALSRQVRSAVDAGATLSTHLGNGAHRELRRHPNYIWDQMAEDRLSASLIADGHHLPAEVIKSIVRAKTPERCILVSDLSGLAGLPPGRYPTQLCELEILPDGRLVIAGQDQLLAGASRPIGVGIANVMRYAGVDLATAINMATAQPARLIGLPPNQLQVGDPADVVTFRLTKDATGSVDGLEVVSTIAAGSVVYNAER